MPSTAPPDAVISHWSTLIENFQVSPLGFYKQVEEALVRRQIPETKNSRVDYKESGLLSASREYLHVSREKLDFDICGAPFGTGFFVSWWLTEQRVSLNPLIKLAAVFGLFGVGVSMLSEFGIVTGLFAFAIVLGGGLWMLNAMANNGDFNDDIVRVIPILGPLYNWLFKATTFYRIDTTLMFQKAVHNAVLEVIDEMTAGKGVRALSELDRKPIMREFYQRKAA